MAYFESKTIFLGPGTEIEKKRIMNKFTRIEKNLMWKNYHAVKKLNEVEKLAFG